MADCPKNSIDSNVAGLRYAEEVCLKQLPVLAVDGFDPTWLPLDPNSFSDFGGDLKTVARNPINPSRQRRKGVITDLDASGGFQQDLTQMNLRGLFQGFMFATWRQRPQTAKFVGAATPVTAVAGTAKQYSTTLTGVVAGDVIVAAGFAQAANNGVRHVTAAAGGNITVAEALADETTPPTSATLRVVAKRFASADLSIVLNGTLARLTSAAVDMSTLGFILGEWIYLGSDTPANRFANNVGFARIGAINEDYIEFDKTDWVPAAEAGTAKLIEFYLGDILKNEEDPALIVRRSYDLERTVGNDADGVMSEHITGAVPNQLTINVKQADKITADLTFVGCDHEQRDGDDGLKGGTRPDLLIEDAFNTSSDFARIKLASVTGTNSYPTPIFAYSTDLTLTINNNVSGSKALGVLGNFDTDVGMFEVGGSVTAYFADMAGTRAVRNNADITLDVAIVKNNAGMLFDIPLLSLGNGRLAVEMNKKITLPLDLTAAENVNGYTLLFQTFAYLPSLANPN
jgi:hypothetical protein